jgi:hypothetical protein
MYQDKEQLHRGNHTYLVVTLKKGTKRPLAILFAVDEDSRLKMQH